MKKKIININKMKRNMKLNIYKMKMKNKKKSIIKKKNNNNSMNNKYKMNNINSK